MSRRIKGVFCPMCGSIAEAQPSSAWARYHCVACGGTWRIADIPGEDCVYALPHESAFFSRLADKFTRLEALLGTTGQEAMLAELSFAQACALLDADRVADELLAREMEAVHGAAV